jgi:hypothetical protein
MKKALPLLILLAMAIGVAHAATPTLSNKYQHISYTWNAPNSTYPNCSATVTSSCLNNYTLSQIMPSGAAVLLTIPNGGVVAGGIVAYLYGTTGAYLQCGTWNANVVANYLDDTGATISSSPNATTLAVACPLVASPATGLVGNPTP